MGIVNGYIMGRKLPKKAAFKRSSTISSSKFPSCIGRFPECKGYTAEMSTVERVECKFCPYK